MALVLKYSNAGIRNDCGLCGKYNATDIGFEIFIENSWRSACDECAMKDAPELIWARNAIHRYDPDYRSKISTGELNEY